MLVSGTRRPAERQVCGKHLTHVLRAFVQDVNHYHALRQSLCNWSIEYSGSGHIDSLGCTGPDVTPPKTLGHLLYHGKKGGAPGGHGDPFSFRTNNPEPYAVSKQMEPLESRRHFPLGF